MIIKNPTKDELTVKIFGNVYTLEGESELSVKPEVAEYWKGKLHHFLTIEEEVEAKLPSEELADEVNDAIESGELTLDESREATVEEITKVAEKVEEEKKATKKPAKKAAKKTTKK